MDKVLTGKLTFHSLKPCDLSNTTKSEIRDYFENSYDLDESLFTSLKDESVFYKCPDRLRLPLIFYYGHTACVYINKMILADLIKPSDRVNLELETIFETGVDEMSWDDTENYRMGGKYKWPALDDVIEYRRCVRHLILDCIEKTPLQLPITKDSPWWGLFMGMEHERIHLETSSVLIRQLPVHMVQKPDGFVYGPVKGPTMVEGNAMLQVPAQEVTLGKPVDFPSYGWDNEYGEQHCKVPAFCASKYLITNREFLQFVQAGGYNKRAFWTDEGWKWKVFCEANHPIFWVCHKGCKSRCGENVGNISHCQPDPKTDLIINHITNGSNSYCNGHETTDNNGHQGSGEGGGLQYRYRCMFDIIQMPLDWPVEVNYHEAKAYCSWKGSEYRLPSEAEHNVMRGSLSSVTEGTSCDIIYQSSINCNLNLQYGSSTPVNLFPPTDLGFHDVMGNVWEWTEDHFNGLPGFATSALYDDFSVPCFDGQHNIIMGGSWISTGDEASRFARFAFRRHFMQHCGFRIVRSASDKKETEPICILNTPIYIQSHGYIDNEVPLLKQVNVEPVQSSFVTYTWDTKENIHKQLKLEYTDETLTLGLLEQIIKWLDEHKINRRRFLHLGCGAGNLSFRLSSLCDQLLATDTSGYLIDVCLRLQSGDIIELNTEQPMKISAPVNSSNITFKQFTWLPNEVGYFDMVVASQFDRVQNVSAWVLRLREIVNKDGLLIIVSGDSKIEPNITSDLHKCFVLMNSHVVTGKGGTKVTISAWIHQ